MSGAAPNPLRRALWPLGLLYGGAMALRNWGFRSGILRVERVEAPVLSVGNLTVGGTGKTPAVAWIAERARSRGRRPAVVARGYGRVRGAALNDEGAMLRRRMPWLVQEQDPDRAAAARRAIARGADYLILDDGFQHRRLHRDADVLCLDAGRPFADGFVLPAGDLREFHTGIRRASWLLLTRAGRLSDEQRRRCAEELRRLARREIDVFFAEHEPVDVLDLPRGEVRPLSSLRGRRVVLLSAIARPSSFAELARELGAEIRDEIRFRDHHRFSRIEVERAAARARDLGAVLLSTEKDAPRLEPFSVPFCVLRISLGFLGEEPRAAQLLLS
ncbi:MAG: tetraacyldisaccharide 4'-kinase [Planctomycetota bacterium]